MGRKRSKQFEKFLEKVRAKLLKLRQEIADNIESGLGELQNTEAYRPADLGGEEFSDSTDDFIVPQLLEMGATRLEEIDRALERLDNDTYGYCLECERPIGLERLKALPFAELCIDCKRKEEQGLLN